MPKFLCLLMLLLLSGCSQISYYDQLLRGQFDLIDKRRALTSVVADPDSAKQLRQRLQIAQQMRDFATEQLALPDNDSYRSYADVGRNAVIYNIFAAPELNLSAYEWCYPMIGCVSYRGYFDRSLAEQEATRLEQQSLETYIADIPAYSTLGWFADPLLNTFIDWPLGLLAELIFHELAHQHLYIADDTDFNEAFATAVGQLGANLWLQQHAPEALAEYQQLKRYQTDFLKLIFELRQKLEQLYASELSPEQKRQRKQALFQNTRAHYQQQKSKVWQNYTGYDRWINEDLNNAKLAPISAYHRAVPAFLQLFAQSEGEFIRFYNQVKQLAALPVDERNTQLKQLISACHAAAYCNANDLARR